MDFMDISGVILTPGNEGEECLGNGKCFDQTGSEIECCCNECDYFMCCIKNACQNCSDTVCIKNR